MSEGWTTNAWPVGIVHYEAALKQPYDDASARATVAAYLEKYQIELDDRRKARRTHRAVASRVW